MATHSKTRSTIPHAGQTTLPTLPSLEQPLPVLSPDQLKPDKYSRMCEDCNGEGVTDTRSKVLGQTELPCLDCGGKGWIPIGDERRGRAAAVVNGPSRVAFLLN